MTDQPSAFAALSYYDEDDVYPVSRITAAPVGDPRQRYFILQAHIGDEPVSWVIERDQARALSRQIPLLLTDIRSEFPELADPLVAAVESVRLAHPEQTVAVFSHADPIKLAVAFYLGTPLDLFQRIDVAPASITELVFEPCRPRLARLNDCAHIS